jgi:hypothetical protein
MGIVGYVGVVGLYMFAPQPPQAENCIRLWEQPWLASMMREDGTIDGKCVWTSPR